ncbi:MAG: hypothetical protein KBF28_06035 [Gemmatimonadales bacterium]|nr:hypothetical protein [Gemmatimonadales bacterium]
MTATRWLAAAAGTTIPLILLVVTSGPAVRQTRMGDAQLRLSWRARPERIEECRRPSAEELAEVAEHMRQRVICTGVEASYTLRVAVDDSVLTEEIVRGGGLRHDRPLSLLREFPIHQGAHRIHVTLRRREAPTVMDTSLVEGAEPDTGLYAGRAKREASERSRRTLAAIPPSLLLDTVVTFGRARVVLVTFDADIRGLLVVGGGR